MNIDDVHKTYIPLLAQGRRFSEDEVTAILQQVLSQRVQNGTTVQGGSSPETAIQNSRTQPTMLQRSPTAIPDAYLPPECQKTGQATPASDIYALGVTMVALLTGKSPELLRNSDGTWNWEDYCLVNDRLAGVLNRAIAAHPEHRYANAWQMQQALNPTADFTPVAPTLIESPLPNSSYSDRVVPTPTPQATQLSTTSPRQFPLWLWGIMAVAAILIFGSAGFGVSRWLTAKNSTATPNHSSHSPSVAPASPETPAKPVNPFKTVAYPQSSCGDLPPANPNAYPVTFYPVFLEKSDRNLQKVKWDFCRDAYPMIRKDTDREAIQVASFSTRERAELFAEFLQETVGWAEVGQVTIVYEMPE